MFKLIRTKLKNQEWKKEVLWADKEDIDNHDQEALMSYIEKYKNISEDKNLEMMKTRFNAWLVQYRISG